MKRKFNDITAFIIAMTAAFMFVSCKTEYITGDTPLDVEAESAQLKGSFKLLSWNIQDGMWCDQFNNYDEFVAYVNGSGYLLYPGGSYSLGCRWKEPCLQSAYVALCWSGRPFRSDKPDRMDRACKALGTLLCGHGPI